MLKIQYFTRSYAFTRFGWPALALAFLTLGLAFSAMAQEEEGAEGQIYVPLSQPLVVNYGGPGRLKYLRAEISVRVEDGSDAAIIRHHMPLIRHKMVMLFSRQGEETVNTQAGREQLRQMALSETNEALAQEEGREGIVTDLVFRNFVVQR
ncbi:flagellar basal body-associated FliL family protein [Marinimicrobium locisalis]|uniref:flagellar basal body-associated FliL family protein n=1 Tax=Marinimicrobium locisalis TaxID=546022 RepID=UPI0032217A31